MTIGRYCLHVPGMDYRRDHQAAYFADLGFEVITDPDRNGVMRTRMEVLRRIMGSEDEWALMVQDDAIPFAGWEEELEPAVRNSPSPLLSFMHFGRAGQDAAARGFAYGYRGVWGLAVAIWKPLAAQLLILSNDALAVDPTYVNDDGVMWLWSLKHGTPLAYTSRALFDHPDWPSTMGHAGRQYDRRRPLLSIEEDGPAWDTPGAWGGHKPYIGNPTKRVQEALGL